jgi:hypothetical protein
MVVNLESGGNASARFQPENPSFCQFHGFTATNRTIDPHAGASRFKAASEPESAGHFRSHAFYGTNRTSPKCE